ncbi:MAG TPA: hypothetical protein VFI95_03500 [Terriglobales bacterium]|nr:hypothetical protein [Terriglobales bacterium]
MKWSWIKAHRLFMLAAVLVLTGTILLSSLWHGNLTVSGAFPFSSSAVQLTGSAGGGLALLGFFCTILGLILLAASLIVTIIESVGRFGKSRSSS